MYENFKIAYLSNSHNINSSILNVFIKFKEYINFKTYNTSISKTILKPENMDQLLNNNYAIVIFDCLKESEISYDLIKQIKTIYPYTHFIYFCKKYDENLFLKILKKEIEFCISLDFFNEFLFIQTLYNIFKKIYTLSKLNQVVIYGNDICLNLIDRKTWKNGKELTLTKTEFDLLKFFIEHPNVYFKNSEILYAVWGYTEDNTGIISQYIFKLKKKIGKENIVGNRNGFCFPLKEFKL